LSAGGPQVSVQGTALTPDAEALLDVVVVDQDVNRPDMFELRFRDPSRSVLDQVGLRIGAEVSIAADSGAAGARTELIVADVTSLEAELDHTGSHLVARGYDRSYRLARSARAEAYHDVTDGDLVRAVARRTQVPLGQVGETTTVYPHVFQPAITDWAFLHKRARAIGWLVTVEGGKLNFDAPTPASEAPDQGDFDSQSSLQLVYGANLLTFRARVSSAGLADQVEVRGWDPVAKQALVASTAVSSAGASLNSSPASLAAASGAEPHVSVRQVIDSPEEAQAAADALAGRLGSTFAEAEGVAAGDPRLAAGAAVHISMVGAPFEGRYTLTRVRHTFDARSYRTQFAVSGAHDRSLLGLIEPDRPSAFLGVLAGVVSDIDDPERLGRVRLHLPCLSDDYETDWARVAQMMAGAHHGSAFIPNVDDEVLVAFDHGDIRRPYVLGALFNRGAAPALGGDLIQGGQVARSGLASGAGHHVWLIDSSQPTLEVSAAGELVLQADRRVRIKAPELVLEGDQQVSLQAQGSIKLKASGEVSVDGSLISLGGGG
jgi:phage protein D/phage baseplate assembly protein gpV